MNTPAHLLVGAAAFARPGDRSIIGLAFLGALIPDLSLYVLAGVSLFILGIAPSHVFGTLYFSPAWQTVFAIDNSILLWGGLLGFALWSGRAGLVAFAGAALLHLLLDLPLHHDDGRAHFWPLTVWVFESPFSYWDSGHHARWIAPMEAALATVLALVLFRRFSGWIMRIFVLLLLAAEFWVVRQWLWFF